jgi:hypothetical protein
MKVVLFVTSFYDEMKRVGSITPSSYGIKVYISDIPGLSDVSDMFSDPGPSLGMYAVSNLDPLCNNAA